MNDFEKSKIYVELIVSKLEKIAPNRFSSALVNQIAYFPYKGMASPHQFILPEIEHLEDPNILSDTKKADEFTANPEMVGLWKKHFFLPTYIARNYYNYWKLDKAKSQKFYQKFHELFDSYNQEPTEEKALEVSSKIAHDFVEIARLEFDSGKRKKTGEYIIFKKHNGLNYYLCLGSHKSDDTILKWVKEAYKEFPFLRDTE